MWSVRHRRHFRCNDPQECKGKGTIAMARSNNLPVFMAECACLYGWIKLQAIPRPCWPYLVYLLQSQYGSVMLHEEEKKALIMNYLHNGQSTFFYWLLYLNLVSYPASPFHHMVCVECIIVQCIVSLLSTSLIINN